MKKSEESLYVTKDIIKRSNLQNIRITKGEEKEKGADSLFKEIIAENFPNLGRDINMLANQVQPKEIFTETHYNKTQKSDKKRNLKAAGEKKLVTYKGILRVSGFPSRNLSGQQSVV